MEGGLDAVVGFRTEGHDFLFAVHDEAQGDALHAPGAELGLYFSPEDGGKLESHQAVQHAAGLLGVHQVHVDIPGVLNGAQDGVFGNFVENDAAGFFGGEFQNLLEVPGNGFPFAVFIGGQPDGVRGLGKLAEFGHDLLLVGRNHIFGLEAVFDINAEFVLFQVTDVSDGCLYQIFFSQILLDGFHLTGRLYDD